MNIWVLISSKKIFLILLIFILLGFQVSQSESIQNYGITLQSTRLIYNEEQRNGILFKVKNNTKKPYLIQSQVGLFFENIFKVTETKFDKKIPFIVLPPLKRLNAQDDFNLVIRLINYRDLPSDRESVFALRIKAIPEGEGEQPNGITEDKLGEMKVMLAVQNTMKLFYRPNSLPDYNPEKIADSLIFVHSGKSLVVSNPTPFYITLKTLCVGETDIDDKALFQMIPPFGKLSFPVKASARGNVTWQLITDYGSATRIHTRSLQE